MLPNMNGKNFDQKELRNNIFLHFKNGATGPTSRLFTGQRATASCTTVEARHEGVQLCDANRDQVGHFSTQRPAQTFRSGPVSGSGNEASVRTKRSDRFFAKGTAHRAPMRLHGGRLPQRSWRSNAKGADLGFFHSETLPVGIRAFGSPPCAPGPAGIWDRGGGAALGVSKTTAPAPSDLGVKRGTLAEGSDEGVYGE